MAMDNRKLQKKQQRRNAKERARKKAHRKHSSRDLTVGLERFTAAPVLHCCTTDVLWDQGMAQVLVSRELGGRVAFASFLVDVYCLGVKDVLFDIGSRRRYEEQIYASVGKRFEIVDLEPAAARKLVEGAVAYAHGLGLPPHRDYHKAKAIFGDIDADACSQEFSYGRDGKPCFISGPYDSPSRCRQIIDSLTAHCGPDGFDFVAHMASAGIGSLVSEAELEALGTEVQAVDDGSGVLSLPRRVLRAVFSGS